MELFTELRYGIILILNPGDHFDAFSLHPLYHFLMLLCDYSYNIVCSGDINYGAGNRDRLHSAFRYGTALVSGMMILGTLIVILFPAQLLGLFTASEAMCSFGISAMRIMAVSYLFCGWSTMISTYLQATEQVFPSMLIQLLRQFLLLIPFMWGLEKLLKITGIWLSFPVTETATFVLALLIFRAGRKKETLCSGTKTQQEQERRYGNTD